MYCLFQRGFLSVIRPWEISVPTKESCPVVNPCNILACISYHTHNNVSWKFTWTFETQASFQARCGTCSGHTWRSEDFLLPGLTYHRSTRWRLVTCRTLFTSAFSCDKWLLELVLDCVDWRCPSSCQSASPLPRTERQTTPSCVDNLIMTCRKTETTD